MRPYPWVRYNGVAAQERVYVFQQKRHSTVVNW